MTKRIFRSIFLTALLTLIISMCFFIGVLYDYFGKQLDKELKNEVYYVAHGLSREGIAYFDNLSDIDNRLTWIDTDGAVLYDSEEEAEEMENHGDREEFGEAMENGTGKAQRYSATLYEKTVYYAQKMEDGTVIRISDSQYSIWILIWGMLQSIIIIVLFLIGFSAFFASKLSKRIVKPLNEIDLNNPAYDESYEELAPLLTKINKLSKKIAAQLQEASRRQHEFSMITENMEEGFLIADKNTDILSYNSSVLKIFNIDGDLSNRSLLTLNRSEKFRNAVELSLKGQNNDQIIMINDHYYEIIANPVYYEEVVSGVIMVIMDITEKAQRDFLRREFTSNVSHELRTPLTGILGTAEIIMNKMVKPGDIPQFARNIHKEADRLITLINDIINLSQLDENSLQDEKETVDLYAMSENVLSLLKEAAGKKNITLELEGGHITVFGIHRILEEMIYNLCDNGIKYNKENGKVTVSVTQDEEKIFLIVKDTGIGISPAHTDRVFERFYRVDKSHSKDIGGTGLGLSIAKHGAIYHGATITLNSKIGEGTTVIVCWDNQSQKS